MRCDAASVHRRCRSEKSRGSTLASKKRENGLNDYALAIVFRYIMQDGNLQVATDGPV
jgi:hypothetical protein